MTATLTTPGPRVGTLLTQAREDAGLTQDQLAEKLGVNRTTIYNWEKGKRFPNIMVWAQIIELTGAEWLADVRKLPSHWNVQDAFQAA